MSHRLEATILIEYDSQMTYSAAMMRSILLQAAESAINQLDLNKIPYKNGKDADFYHRTEVVMTIKEPS